MIVTEVKAFVFKRKDAPFYVDRGWEVFSADLENGVLTAYAKKRVYLEEGERPDLDEEPTPGLKPE